MSAQGYALGGSIFNNVTVVAGTIAALIGAVTAITTAVRAVRGSRRFHRAQMFRAGWSASDAEHTGALVHNESERAFNDVVVTVMCGPGGREAQLDLGLLPARQNRLWASGPLHDTINSRLKVAAPADQYGPTHQSRLHTVQATFGDGKGFWFRQGNDVQRVRSLVIWAERTRAGTLERYFGRRSVFRRAYPLVVKVHSFDNTEELEHAFTRLAAGGEPPRAYAIPDIVVGPHDWIGRVVDEESVVEQPESDRFRQYSPKAREALRRGGPLYAIPYVFDSVALIRNDAVAGTGALPDTFDALVEAATGALPAGGIPIAMQVGKPNKHGDAGDPYHMWPLFASAGGSFFGLNDVTGWPADPESWRSDFVSAFVRLAERGSGGDGTLLAALGRSEALAAFLDGRAPFLISSSRALASIKDRGLTVTVGHVPGIGVSAARPMVSVYGFFIYRNAPNLPAARDLLASYMSQPNAGLDLNRVQQLVPVQEEAMDIVADRDPLLAPYVENCRGGQIMPSYPEMRAAWQLLGTTEYEVLAGQGDPAEVAERAARTGWDLLEQARQGR